MRKGKSFLRDFHQMRILFPFLNARMRTIFTPNRKNGGQKFSTDYRIGYEKRIGFTIYPFFFSYPTFFWPFSSFFVYESAAGYVFTQLLFSKLKYCGEYFAQRSSRFSRHSRLIKGRSKIFSKMNAQPLNELSVSNADAAILGDHNSFPALFNQQLNGLGQYRMV